MAGFPGVVGLIDGTLIRVKGPSIDDNYRNRKGQTSINAQVNTVVNFRKPQVSLTSQFCLLLRLSAMQGDASSTLTAVIQEVSTTPFHLWYDF